MVHGLHVQDHLRIAAPRPPRVPAPPHPELEALHRGLQDAHGAHQPAVLEQRLKKAEDVEKRKQYRLERQREAEEKGEEYVEDPRYYVGEDGVRRRRVKRWFGIWE